MPSPAGLPPGVESQQIETSRLRTHVLTAGPPDAPLLVLVHGNVSAARFFAETMVALASGYRCVAPDLRGFGRSERAPVDARRGVRDFADDLHALLTEGGLRPGTGPLHLLGWSLGGGVALQYAADHPGAAASVILESPMSPFGFGGTRDTGGTPCWPDYAGSGGGTASPEMVRRIEAGDRGTDDQTSPRQVLTHLYGNPVALPPDVEDALVEAMLEMAIGRANYPGDTAVSTELAGRRPGRARRQQRHLPEVLRPVRLRGPRGPAGRCCGSAATPTRSSRIPPWSTWATSARSAPYRAGPARTSSRAQPMVGQMRAVLERYQAAGGRYTELVLPGCGHSPHLERPAEFAAAVTGFLASVPAR